GQHAPGPTTSPAACEPARHDWTRPRVLPAWPEYRADERIRSHTGQVERRIRICDHTNAELGSCFPLTAATEFTPPAEARPHSCCNYAVLLGSPYWEKSSE